MLEVVVALIDHPLAMTLFFHGYDDCGNEEGNRENHGEERRIYDGSFEEKAKPNELIKFVRF